VIESTVLLSYNLRFDLFFFCAANVPQAVCFVISATLTSVPLPFPFPLQGFHGLCSDTIQYDRSDWIRLCQTENTSTSHNETRAQTKSKTKTPSKVQRLHSRQCWQPVCDLFLLLPPRTDPLRLPLPLPPPSSPSRSHPRTVSLALAHYYYLLNI